MIDPFNRPSRLLRCIAGFARWSLGCMLAFWLLLAAVWGALHGWIVPRIGDFRPQLEAQAARALGAPVRIGSITARSQGLIPSFELLDVALLDAQGRAALQLPRVVAALSPRSLLNWGFAQLYIEHPDLDIRRQADGRIVVAGLTFSETAGEDNAAADWLFSQGEVVIQGGTLRWTDELRGAPELALKNVDVLLRNGSWQHNMRMAATPPPAWGDRFTLTGLFRAPLLHARDGDWQHWSGQLFADFSRVDVSRLRHHADVGFEVARGQGAVRAWADVQRGQIVGGTADLALAEVNATLGPQLKALALPSIEGRLGGRRLQGGFEFYTQGLQFVTDDGLRVLQAQAKCPPRVSCARTAWILPRWPRSAAACRWERPPTPHCKPTPPRGWSTRCMPPGVARSMPCSNTRCAARPRGWPWLPHSGRPAAPCRA
jgi:uncharacterized protein YhdP